MTPSGAGPVRDVAVVGAGPAGAATARRLAKAGRSVVLLERTAVDDSPRGRPRGLDPAGLAVAGGVGSVRGARVGAILGDPQRVGGPGSGRPHPPVRHPRAGLACGPARLRQDAGERRRGRRRRPADGLVRGALHPDASGWRIRSTDGRTVRARVLVDATGRRAGPGRSLGASRESFDRLVAVSGGWSGVDVTAEQYLLIEAADQGWWYTAPIPGGERVGMLLTDADLCRRFGLAEAASWHAALLAARATAGRVGGRPRAAGCACTRPAAADWCATAIPAPGSPSGMRPWPSTRSAAAGSCAPCGWRRPPRTRSWPCWPGLPGTGFAPTRLPLTRTARSTSPNGRAVRRCPPVRHAILGPPPTTGLGLTRLLGGYTAAHPAVVLSGPAQLPICPDAWVDH